MLAGWQGGFFYWSGLFYRGGAAGWRFWRCGEWLGVVARAGYRFTKPLCAAAYFYLLMLSRRARHFIASPALSPGHPPPRFPRILLCVKHCLSRALVIAARHIMSVGQRVSYMLAGRNFYWNWIFYVDFGDFGAGRPRSS